MSAHLQLRITKLQSELALWLPLNPSGRVDCWSFDENLTFDVPKAGLIDNRTVFCETCKDIISDHIDSEDEWVNFTQMNTHNWDKDMCDVCAQNILFQPDWNWINDHVLIQPGSQICLDATPDHVWALHLILERVLAVDPNNTEALNHVVSTLETAFQIAKRTHP